MWKGLFDLQTLTRGEKIPSSSIVYLKVDDMEVNAKLQGTSLYDIKIDKYLNMSCSCPQATYYGSCKHMVCILLKNDENKEKGLHAIEFDYSKQEEHLAEISKRTAEYLAQQAAERQECDRIKLEQIAERKRIKSEQIAEHKRLREEEALKEKERRAFEREMAKKAKLEAEDNERRSKLIDKLSILDIPNLNTYTTEQLKVMRAEKQQEIVARRIEKAKAEKKIIAIQRQAQLEKERVENEKINKKDTAKKKIHHVDFGEGTIVQSSFDNSNGMVFYVKFQDQVVRSFTLSDLFDKSLFNSDLSTRPQTKKTSSVKKERTLKVGDIVSTSPEPDHFSMDTFGVHTQARCQSAFFVPNQWRRKNEEKYVVWYTNFNRNPRQYHNKQIWNDEINEKKDHIIRTYIDDDVEKLSEVDLRWNDSKFLVFAWDCGAYRFYGVFQIEKIEELQYIQITYKKISDSVTYNLPRTTTL